ncbi:MAG: 5-formyltetrahydrofolate cyclo-ligase [Clostridia bacterium]|nr:5-formyltetrahydrofolate cyclo-ligase [Clostridia bacterium]
MEKTELRKQLKAMRNALSAEERRGKAADIAEAFIRSYGRFSSFMAYSAIRSEVPTEGLIQALLDLGRQVFLPRVEGEDIVPVPYGELSAGAFGILEPAGKAADTAPDVCIVPLLGINREGYRIGYGKGFYDRYLRTHKCLAVGIGYACQIADFAQDPWDEPLDAFISEDGITVFRAGQNTK